MAQTPEPERIIGRYALFGEIAAGGMATVHLGRLLGPAGFARTVAIKRLHPQFAKDPEFVSMFLDEARLAARIRHPNVVSTLDVVALEGELFIVMDYVEGESLARIRRLAGERGPPLPVDVTAAIFVNVLHGLHAAHETHGETGRPLGLIHRDVSPQNILVGTDGAGRLVDFGVAKAAGRSQQTREGIVKGKIAYMAPEQLRRGQLDRRTDLYAAAVVLWETLSGRRLFEGDGDFQIAEQIIHRGVSEPPSHFNAEVSSELDVIVMRGTLRDPEQRFATALEMADALERSTSLATARRVGLHVQQTAAAELQARAHRVASLEAATPMGSPAAVQTPASVPPPSSHGEATAASEPTRAISEPLRPVQGNGTEPSRESTRMLSGPRVPFFPAHATQTLPAPVEPTVLTRRPDVGDPAKTEGAHARRAALFGVGIAFAVAFGVAATLLLVRASSPSEETPPAASVGSIERPMGPSTPSSAATRSTADPEPAKPAPTSTGTGSASASAFAAPRAPRPLPRPTPAPAADKCNPPHYFDGPIKKLKPGCY